VGLLADLPDDLVELTGHFHKQLFTSLAAEQFITMFLGELETSSGKIRYVNAGHEPPLVLRADGTMDAFDSTGLPIAMIEEVVPAASEGVLNPGDLMAVFSDGIPEATTDGDRFLGLDEVKEILVKYREEPLEKIRGRIVSAVANFLHGEPNSDDVTLLLLRRNP
jgi:serine phosphatase RsbU (regulator of sigma subunit)